MASATSSSALHLRLHLHRPRRPCAFKFVVKMACRPLAGEGHILTQQIIGILPGLGGQFDAVVNALGRITWHKLDIVNQVIQHRRISAGITRLTLLVVVRLQPEIAPGIPEASCMMNSLYASSMAEGWSTEARSALMSRLRKNCCWE